MSQLGLLRALIRESLLLEGGQFISIDEVTEAIDNAIRPGRLNIDIPGFRELMIEMAVVETGNKIKDNVFLNNEKSGGIQGVFQISPIALRQLREPASIPKIKARFNTSGASLNTWEKQTDADIFGSLKMQAIAACMYALWIYYQKAGKPSLNTVGQRAAFWKTYYNTPSDPKGSVDLYVNRVKEFLGY